MENRNKVALVTIDVQKGFHDPFWGNRNNPECEKNIENLLAYWRKKGWPVIHVQHASRNERSPLSPERSGFEFMDFIKPQAAEPVFVKHVNSGFIGTALEATLKKNGIRELVLCGFVTDYCVSTSTRMGANLGFKCSVVSDATACFDRVGSNDQVFAANLVHEVNLASLSREFADIVTSGSLTN